MSKRTVIISLSALYILALSPVVVAAKGKSLISRHHHGHRRDSQIFLPQPSLVGRQLAAPDRLRYKSRFSIGPFYQTGSNSFGLYDFFAPLTISYKSILFADARYLDRGSTGEYNLGAGFRHITNSGEFLWTLYTFYDKRKTRFNNYFGQVTVGGDLQTEKWYFNTNGYIPVGNTQQVVSNFNTAYLCSNNTRICYARGIEKSMGGWDAEVGRNIFGNLKGYAGMYVFARKGVQSAIGPNLRLQYNIERRNQKRVLYLFNKIALIANWRDDKLVGSSWYAGVRFDIGIGPEGQLVGLERKMTSFIRRDLNVEMSSDAKGDAADLTEPVKVLINDFNTQETQVALVSSAADILAATTNARNNIIGVIGTITPGANVLPSTNQVIEGGVFSFTREGQNFSVQVGQNGGLTLGGNAIRVASAATVGQNVTIENLTTTNTANTAIDSVGANALGTLSVLNNVHTGTGQYIELLPTIANTDDVVSFSGNIVTGTGGVGLVRISSNTQATSSVTLIINGNQMTNDNAAFDLFEASGATSPLNISFTNNIINTNSGGPSVSIQTSPFAGGDLVTVTGNMSGNTVINTGTNSSDAAVFISGNVVVAGDISNNTFSSAGAYNLGEGTLKFYQFPIGSAQVSQVLGAITGNTIIYTGNDTAMPAIGFLALRASDSVTVAGGIVNNTISTSGAVGVQTVTGTGVGAVTIGAFNNNIFDPSFAAGGAIVTNVGSSGTTTITIGGGAASGTVAALAAANGLVVGDITTAATTVINP